MNRAIFAAILSATVTLTGCMSGVSSLVKSQPTLSLEKDVPAQRQSCCGDLSELSYQPLAAGTSKHLLIDQSAPVFEFAKGKSLFVAYQLPELGSALRVKLRSLVQDGQVFQPTVLLLNSQFQPVREFTSAAFPYIPAKGFTGDSLYGEFDLRQYYPGHADNERYLIIYTTRAQQSGETTLLHPAKAYAKAKGNEPPNVPDPIAQHSAGGLLQLKVSGVSQQSLGETLLKPLLGNSSPQPVQAAMVPPPVQQNTAADVAGDVLPETEAYYQRAVDNALKADDLDKALRLAEEARRVGAVEVREYLLQKLRVK